MTFSEINLSNLNGSNGFTLNGYVNSVSGAGDVNNDGIDDLIIGAPSNNINDLGQSYIVFGRRSGFPANFNLSNLNGSNGFTLNGIAGGVGSVSDAGDVNNDGIDDLIIGAPYNNINGYLSGKSYVVFGRSNGFSASLNLSSLSLNGSNGFTLNGVAASLSGAHVSRAGDINNDGIDDLIIGAPGNYLNGGLSGKSYVVFGRSSGFAASLNFSSLNGSNGFTLNGVVGGTLGSSISAVGDVNNDGIDDLIIGDPSYGNYQPPSGQCYVVFGRSGGFGASLDISSLNGSNGFIINGLPPYYDYYDNLGSSVSGAGDVNNDGIDDLIIGTGYFPGQCYVVFGRSGGFGASLDISSLNGSNGFKIVGVSSSGSVSRAGDVNDDGIDDLIVGNYPGQSVVFGRSGGFKASLDLSSLNSSEGFNIPAITSSVYSDGGYGSKAGDVNNDGIDDLIVTYSTDQSYVVFGVAFPSGTPSNDVLTGTENNDTLEGLAGNDTLSGRLGDDVLDGGSGTDVLMGQRGNDIYIIDSIADSIVEIANQGTDTIRPFFSYTLGLTFERLGIQGSGNFTGTGNTLDNYISGNVGNNVLMGLAGNDTLMGGEGIDTLTGGSNDDVYYLESISDRVLESANQGTDTVRSFINYILEANVERLGLQGFSNLEGTGNSLANYISGNIGRNLLNGQAGNDSLNGGVGDDTLNGGAGNDLLIGDIGDDRFLYSTGAVFTSSAIGVDRLTDFRRFAGGNTDKIVLSQTTFAAGTNFASVGTDALAATSAAQITFSTGTGRLFYNQNGSAAGLGTGGHFATLSDINSESITSTNTLLATDFLVIA